MRAVAIARRALHSVGSGYRDAPAFTAAVLCACLLFRDARQSGCGEPATSGPRDPDRRRPAAPRACARRWRHAGICRWRPYEPRAGVGGPRLGSGHSHRNRCVLVRLRAAERSASGGPAFGAQPAARARLAVGRYRHYAAHRADAYAGLRLQDAQHRGRGGCGQRCDCAVAGTRAKRKSEEESGASPRTARFCHRRVIKDRLTAERRGR